MRNTAILHITKSKAVAKLNIKKSFAVNFEFINMCLPVFVVVLIYCYIPMFGVILAFKDFNIVDGILNSPWVGIQNFKFFFVSQDVWRITRNTIGLNFIFICMGTLASVGFALLMFDIKKRWQVKIYQTCALLPNFLSWVVVGYMSYALLNPSLGLINKSLFPNDGGIDWYSRPDCWPLILTITYIWKSTGIGSIIYYAGLMGIDNEYFEAAAIDGASKLKMTYYISIPFIMPLIVVLTILAVGGIFRADFGLFYNITRDVGKLYPTTDVIDTYVYRALRQSNDVGMTTAIGLYQSIVGFVVIIITNQIVRKIDSEKSLF